MCVVRWPDRLTTSESFHATGFPSLASSSSLTGISRCASRRNLPRPFVWSGDIWYRLCSHPGEREVFRWRWRSARHRSVRQRRQGLCLRQCSTGRGSGLVMRSSLPPAVSPDWSKTFSSASAFFGVVATNEGVYAAGQSLGLTNDNIGGNETKTLLSKFRSRWRERRGAVRIDLDHGRTRKSRSVLRIRRDRGLPWRDNGGRSWLDVHLRGRRRRAVQPPGVHTIAKYNTAGAFVAVATNPSGTCPVPSNGASDTQGVATLNGNVYIAGVTGWTHEGDAGGRAALWKYNSNLNLQWRRKSASIGGSFQAVAGIQNSLYAVGSVTPPGGTQDYLIEKLTTKPATCSGARHSAALAWTGSLVSSEWGAACLPWVGRRAPESAAPTAWCSRSIPTPAPN